MSDIQKMNKLSQSLVSITKGTMLAPKEVLQSIERLTPAAVSTLEDLMLNSKADSVKLKAALEVLALGGINKETRITVKHDVQEMGSEEIDSRLKELMSKASAIEADFSRVDNSEATHEAEPVVIQ